jgi:hypothetical protein
VTPWLFVWLLVSLLAGGTLVAITVGLVKRLVVLGRALQQFQDEVTPVADAITRESARVSERGSTIGERSSFRRA